MTVAGKKRLKCVLVLTIVLLLTALGLFARSMIVSGNEMQAYLSHMIDNAATTDEKLLQWLTNDKHFDMEAFLGEYQTEALTLDSSFEAHSIPATYIYAPGNTDKRGNTVIMVHGLAGNRLSNYPMAQMFLSLGYNVITYDQRSSGGNNAPTTTFGYLESNDTVDVAAFARKEMDADSLLGVWGQSMGAATVGNAVDTEVFQNGVQFLVLDSPMGDMTDIIRGQGFFDGLEQKLASARNQSRCGFSYDDQAVLPQLRGTDIPTLVVASTADDSIPFALEEGVYQAVGSANKQLYTVDDSRHSDIYFDHPDEYTGKLREFLNTLQA